MNHIIIIYCVKYYYYILCSFLVLASRTYFSFFGIKKRCTLIHMFMHHVHTLVFFAPTQLPSSAMEWHRRTMVILIRLYGLRASRSFLHAVSLRQSAKWMEWPGRQESLGGWRMGAAQLFSGTWETTIFYNDTEVKVSK